MSETFLPVRVYYEDTDAGGVVYHAGYFRFFERGRTEWLRHFGFEQPQIIAEHGVLFAVHSMNIRFQKPARFNQLLWVGTRLRHMAKASLEFDQRVFQASNDWRPENSSDSQEVTPICAAHVRIACLDSQAFRPRPLPVTIKEEILRARTECQ